MRQVVSGLFALAALPAALMAQDRPAGMLGAEFRSVSYGSGAGYRGTKSVSEFAVPLGFTVPLGRRVTADVGTYFVAANLKDVADSSYTITGLADVVVRGSFQLKPDVAVFTVAFNLPTGQATLDNNQASVAGATATDLIPYPVQNFGTGFNVTTGLALAAPMGSWALGVAGSFRYNGDYQPFTGVDTMLQPGGEIRLRLGVDRIVGQGRFSAGVTFSNFSTDDFGARSNKPGTRFIPQVNWTVPMGNNSLAMYSWDIYRSAAADTLQQPSENTIALGAIMSIRTGRNVLRPQAEFRKAWRNGEDNGNLFGLGARYSIAASRRVSVVPGLRVDFGSLPDPAGAVNFTGFSGSLTIRSTF